VTKFSIESVWRSLGGMDTAKLLAVLLAVVAALEAGALLLLGAILLFGTGGSGTRETAPEKKVAFASPPGTAMGSVRDVILWVWPENSLSSMAAGDIVTASLAQEGITSVPYAIAAVRAAAVRPGGSGAKEPSDAERRDDVQISPRSVDADCLVKITLVPESVQERSSVEGQENRSEVLASQRFPLVTVSISNLEGKLLKVGSISYSEPVPVATAGFDLGEVLVQQLKDATGGAE